MIRDFIDYLFGRAILVKLNRAVRKRFRCLRADLNLKTDNDVIVAALATLELLTKEMVAGGDVVIRRPDGSASNLLLVFHRPVKEPADGTK